MNLSETNRRLNDEEYNERKIILHSYPQAVFIQMDAPCNQDCLFCSRPENYSHFDLDVFRRNFEELMHPVFMRAGRINLTGSGELLSLPEAKRNLDYFNLYTHAEKMFATNGSYLSAKMIDHLAASGSRYLLHISLHGDDGAVHCQMTGGAHFPVILRNLDYLRAVKNQCGNLRYNFIFVATIRNIDRLKNFIRFASDYGADAVIVYYNYVYRLDQKPLSCYFDPDNTNRALEEALELVPAYKESMRIELPPLFGKKYSESESLCSEAWNQFMLNVSGDVISCDVAGDSYENMKGRSDFMQVWNGKYYTGLREKLVKREFDCASFCWRANRNTVNDFKSHVITRGKSDDELKEFLNGAGT